MTLTIDTRNGEGSRVYIHETVCCSGLAPGVIIPYVGKLDACQCETAVFGHLGLG